MLGTGRHQCQYIADAVVGNNLIAAEWQVATCMRALCIAVCRAVIGTYCTKDMCASHQTDRIDGCARAHWAQEFSSNGFKLLLPCAVWRMWRDFWLLWHIVAALPGLLYALGMPGVVQWGRGSFSLAAPVAVRKRGEENVWSVRCRIDENQREGSKICAAKMDRRANVTSRHAVESDHAMLTEKVLSARL